MKNPQILVVDDSKPILTLMKEFLEEEGYQVATAVTAKEALLLIEKKKPDLVILDIKLPDMDGLDALIEIKKRDPKLSVIMMTAFGTTQTAIQAMKRGAYDYVAKPFKNEELKALIKKALEAGRLMKESVSYQAKKSELIEGVCIIGESPQMLEIYKTIGKVADSNALVLIRGESGTGKELVARAIYQNSSRKDKPFLAVNCAAIPESLLESELFGHEKGSFTGAINKRIGKFQQCDEGTIFLDEIGDMSLSTQTKILRVLQEHTFEAVGSENTVKVDVRVIASTNKDLSKAIEKGEFREDLYYRLKVITIYLPPLRTRIEDIPLLVDYFIQKFNREYNKNVKKISPEVIKHLKNYKWPGNVRELENAIQTGVIMSKKDVLLLDNFPLFTQKLAVINPEMLQQVSNYEKVFKETVRSILNNPVISANGELYKRVMADLEKSLIEAVLDENRKSQTKSAKILGISRNTLRTRMKEYDLLAK
jgi:nitrogen regulation protein NR(I)